MAKILVTGAAGFIGSHLVTKLVGNADEVVGIDNINDYYDVELKYDRLAKTGVDRRNIQWNEPIISKTLPGYSFIRIDLTSKENLIKLFKSNSFDIVIHLAAQAGVRYSIDNPEAYINSNVIGFFNILEACRHYPVKTLVYASSSSVYGNNKKIPFSEEDVVDNPVSLYAATKKSNELMAYSYNHLYGIPAIGLRFFTVYGPWGRPDMAVFKFTKAILDREPLQVFGQGILKRDLTFIDDVTDGIIKVLNKGFEENTPMIMNIGNNSPITVNELISEIESCLNRKALVNYLPVQPGDVDITFADITMINKYCNFKPHTDIRTGISKFCEWYLEYRSKKKIV